MRILVIGQTSLHWGRMEYGNIGNYYIIEPFIRELHRVFKNAEIFTTLQMSDEFCLRENVARLPIELFYSWDDKDYLKKCSFEYALADIFKKTGSLIEETPYIKEVLKSDLVIDFSGDIWSDNADFVGPNRFLIGLLKDRIAQLLGKKTVMLSGSPSPFKYHNHKLTKEVFEGFDLVTNRERFSSRSIQKLGFDTSRMKSFACPAFIFESTSQKNIQIYLNKYKFEKTNIKTGFILCGWNLKIGPYDRVDIDDIELLDYVELIEENISARNTDFLLISHSNGFNIPPNFKLKHGRDFPFAQQLLKILKSRNRIDLRKVKLVTEVMTPKEMKAFIGNLDMLISGRIHGAVAGLSQGVPTVIIDYGHEPKANKLKGFAEVAGVDKFVVDPNRKDEMFQKVEECYNSLTEIRLQLEIRMIEIRKLVNNSFDILKEVVNK